MLGNQTIFHHTCNNNYIFLFFPVWGNGKYSWPHRIRQFNKILEGQFDLILFYKLEQIVELIRKALKLFSCFCWRISEEVFSRFGLKLWKFLQETLCYSELQVNILFNKFFDGHWRYKIKFRPLITIQNLHIELVSGVEFKILNNLVHNSWVVSRPDCHISCSVILWLPFQM